MKGFSPQPPDPGVDRADTAPEEWSTQQEGSVVPWFAGERKLALRWLSPVYSQFTAESGDKRAIYTTGVGAIAIDTLAACVIGIERINSIDLSTLSVSVAGQETFLQAVELSTLAPLIAGQETFLEAVELSTLSPAVVGHETLLEAVELSTLAVVVIGDETY